MVKVTLEVPDEVDKLLKALGRDESFYQYDFLESMRSWLECAELVQESPAVEEAIGILYKKKQIIQNSWNVGATYKHDR